MSQHLDYITYVLVQKLRRFMLNGDALMHTWNTTLLVLMRTCLLALFFIYLFLIYLINNREQLLKTVP